jgi:hypothetical protein
MDKAVEMLKEEAVGLRKRLRAIEGSIKLLGGSGSSTTHSAKPAKKKRHLSAASRKKLSEAAKRRWAGHKSKTAT